MEASLWLNGRSQNVAKGWLSDLMLLGSSRPYHLIYQWREPMAAQLKPDDAMPWWLVSSKMTSKIIWFWQILALTGQTLSDFKLYNLRYFTQCQMNHHNLISLSNIFWNHSPAGSLLILYLTSRICLLSEPPSHENPKELPFHSSSKNLSNSSPIWSLNESMNIFSIPFQVLIVECFQVRMKFSFIHTCHSNHYTRIIIHYSQSKQTFTIILVFINPPNLKQLFLEPKIQTSCNFGQIKESIESRYTLEVWNPLHWCWGP